MGDLCVSFVFIFVFISIVIGEISVLEMMTETLVNAQNPVIVQDLVVQRSKQ